MKIAFARQFAIDTLTALYDPDDYDPEDIPSFTTMSNEKLESELCLSGCIHDDDMAGVFDVLPANILDAEAQSAKTGWPVTP